MKSSMARRMAGGEVNRVESVVGRGSDVLNKVDRLAAVTAAPLAMAKAKVGACIRMGIGDDALKEYGDKGQMSNVVNGPAVPNYLAKLYDDRAARRRFALALLNDDSDVIVTTVVTVPTKVR